MQRKVLQRNSLNILKVYLKVGQLKKIPIRIENSTVICKIFGYCTYQTHFVKDLELSLNWMYHERGAVGRELESEGADSRVWRETCGGEDRDTSSLSLENKEEKAVKKKTPQERAIGEEWIHVYVWLHCSLKIITTLLIDYTPIQNKQFLKRMKVNVIFSHLELVLFSLNKYPKVEQLSFMVVLFLIF